MRNHPYLCSVIATTAWIVILAFCASRSAQAQLSTPPAVKEVQIGFSGKYKVGFWTPVRVTLSAGDAALRGHLELTVLDSDGVRTSFSDPQIIEIPAAAETVIQQYVKIGCLGSSLEVKIRDSQGSVIVRRLFSSSSFSSPLPSSAKLTVIVGRSIGVDAAIQLRQIRGRGDGNIWDSILLKGTTLLPQHWWGYEGIDSMVITTSQQNLLAALTPKQAEALVMWVRMGGRLVLCVGRRGDEIFGSPSRFQTFSPGTFQNVMGQEGTIPLAEFSGLLTIAGIRQTLKGLQVSYFSEVPKLHVISQEQVILRPRTSKISVPTIMRKPFGFGQVVILAFDPDEPPMDSWLGRARLIEHVLIGQFDERSPANEKELLSQASQVGFDDLVGQLRIALEQYQGITLVAFSWVAALVVIYILLIGPGDYFFLKKVVRRMHWTWLTFSLLVLGFSAIAVVLAAQWKGARVHINQVDLIDIDFTNQRPAETDSPLPSDRQQPALVRGTTWVHLYNPQAELIDLALSPQLPGEEIQPAKVLFTWQGLPGQGLGGMDQRPAPSLFGSAYTILSAPPPSSSIASAMAAMPIAASSSKSLTGRWWGQSQIGSVGNLQVRHYPGKIDDNPLEGEIRNPLNIELSDCVLFYGKSAYVLEHSLAAGQSLVLRGENYPPSINRRLKRVFTDGAIDRPTMWNAADTDVPRIIEMMMFYKAAKGRSYTRLSHRYQGFLDMSDHLAMGRAILTGRAAQPSSQISLNGDPQSDNYDSRWTFYRLVIPVKRVEMK